MSTSIQPGRLTYREYVCFPDDGRRHEIIGGDHYVNPAPVPYHQTLSRRIQFQLMQRIEELGLGQIFDAPVDLQLSESDVVQPDLVLLLTENSRIITPTKIKGVPDLVVEILSPSTAKNDRVLKKQLFERSGVPEYWIVDPEEQLIEQWLLTEGSYKLLGSQTKTIAYQGLPDAVVDLTRVW